MGCYAVLLSPQDRNGCKENEKVVRELTSAIYQLCWKADKNLFVAALLDQGHVLNPLQPGAVQKSDRLKERHKYCIKRATASWGSVRVRLSVVRVIRVSFWASLVIRNTNFAQVGNISVTLLKLFSICRSFVMSLFQSVALSILTPPATSGATALIYEAETARPN